MTQISVIIPNYKKLPLIKNLPAVIRACPQAEIIVIDDASPDDTVNYLKTAFPQIKVIKNSPNQRFAGSCNDGVKAASGKIIVLLNSDVVPKPGFLKPLIKHFEDQSVFAVSTLEIQKNGRSGRNRCQFKRGFLIHSAASVVTGNNCWAGGGSSAFDRQKYLQLGGMDKLYSPAYWEDIDLSWRAREGFGWKILFEPKSQVFHNHETTNISVFGQRQMELMALRNQFLFVWKNIRGWKLVQHLLWLPYHFVFTTYRTRGLFIIAFLQALWRKIK